MTTLTVDLPADLYERLQAEATRTGRPIAQLVETYYGFVMQGSYHVDRPVRGARRGCHAPSGHQPAACYCDRAR